MDNLAQNDVDGDATKVLKPGSLLIRQRSRKRELLADILKAKLQEGADLLQYYIRFGLAFAAATAVCLKFATDNFAKRELFELFCYLGIAMCVLGLIIFIFGRRLIRAIERDVIDLAGKLKLPTLPSNQLSLRYTTTSVLMVDFVFCGAWFILLKI